MSKPSMGRVAYSCAVAFSSLMRMSPTVSLGLLGALFAVGCQPQSAVPSDDAAAVPDTSEQLMCTMEFRTISVSVVDAGGTPVTDAQMDVVRATTGRSIVCTGDEENACIEPSSRELGTGGGRYQVVNDGVPVGEREAFVITATRGTAQVQDTLTIGFDGCHVHKIAGPDTLYLTR